MLTSFVQMIINGIAGLGSMLDALPLSPFALANAVPVDAQILAFISLLVPFEQIISLLQAWLLAIGGWYVAKKPLRWAKVIQ